MKPEFCKCGELAVWFYMPGDSCYCDKCVPRGCSCNLDDDDRPILDDKGRELPCVEYFYIDGDCYEP